MNRKKILWILGMAVCCLALYTIVISRIDRLEQVIFPGADGAYVSSDSASFAALNVTETPEPTVDIWPVIDLTMPQYVIVNDSNPLTPSYKPDTGTISVTGYMQFSVLALPYLEDMLQAAQDAGFSVYVGGAYRSYSYQETLFNGKASQIASGKYGVTDYMDPLYQKAAAEARTIVMFPGCSEHQLGLAVDLYDKVYYNYVYENMNQEFYAWLDEHCAEYGFIKRYPTRKLLLTGWDEPWHYRYVGVEAATFIMENGLCYEEFYAHYNPDFRY